jgi:hypothetical protein
MNHTTPKTTPPDTAAAIARILTDLIAEHESLLAAARDHRAALARADRAAIAQAIHTQAAIIERIRDLDTLRRKTFGQTMAVQDLAATLPAPQRQRVIELAAKLREAIEAVRSEQRIVAIASQSLLAHMEGMLQQVAARLNHAGTYGRLGRIDSGSTVVSGIDLTR